MIVSKEMMEYEARNFLNRLFQLQEIERVLIKDIEIQSLYDEENIKKGLDTCFHDILSDIDFVVHLRLNPEDFNEETPIYKKHFNRLGLEGEVFGLSFEGRTLRICLKSGFRMDFICYTRCDDTAPLLPELAKHAIVNQEEYFTNNLNTEKSNSFWFNSILALGKLLRHDHLIANHLSHMLIMEGLVHQMVTRDKNYHTNFHRYGYSEELPYLQVDITPYAKYYHNDTTFNHIVDNLCRAVLSYDILASANSNYQKRSDLFFELWDCYMIESL